MWYVVQVKGGAEQKAIALIEIHAGDDVVKECFTPLYEKMVKFRGEWKTWLMPLLPGYIIVVTDEVNQLCAELKRIPAFTRILGDESGFIPLSQPEMSWIRAFTEKGDRVIGMSEGIIEGDEIIVLRGPLMGHTAWIESVNRHKRLAYLRMNMFGRVITTKCGLSIVSSHQCKESLAYR